MVRTSAGLRPRISLGVRQAGQHLEELVAELDEPIALTVEGQRRAVLVPYAQYVELVGAQEEAQEPPEGAT